MFNRDSIHYERSDGITSLSQIDHFFKYSIVNVKFMRMEIGGNRLGLLIRFLAWTELDQAKLRVSHCIFNCSNHV